MCTAGPAASEMHRLGARPTAPAYSYIVISQAGRPYPMNAHGACVFLVAYGIRGDCNL